MHARGNSSAALSRRHRRCQNNADGARPRCAVDAEAAISFDMLDVFSYAFPSLGSEGCFCLVSPLSLQHLTVREVNGEALVEVARAIGCDQVFPFVDAPAPVRALLP